VLWLTVDSEDHILARSTFDSYRSSVRRPRKDEKPTGLIIDLSCIMPPQHRTFLSQFRQHIRSEIAKNVGDCVPFVMDIRCLSTERWGAVLLFACIEENRPGILST
jgi:hypothetical protein